jgi:hypothetical protein
VAAVPLPPPVADFDEQPPITAFAAKTDVTTASAEHARPTLAQRTISTKHTRAALRRSSAFYVGFATNDLQLPPGLIGPLTTLHVPQLPADGAGMNCWHPEQVLPASTEVST